MKEPFLIWINFSQKRYFALSNDQELLEGKFLIHSLTGIHKSVNLKFILPFEVSGKKAKPYIQAELNNSLKKIQGAFSTLTGLAVLTQGQPIHKTQSIQPLPTPFATLIGISEEGLKENPNVTEEHWQSLVQGCQDLLKGATSDDPSDLNRAKAHIQKLQHHLKSQSVEVDDAIQNLPSKLREKYHSLESDPTLKVSAEELQEATQKVSQSFNDLLKTLKEGAQKVHEVIKEAEAQKNQQKPSDAEEDGPIGQ